jgi:hypothetical protein
MTQETEVMGLARVAHVNELVGALIPVDVSTLSEEGLLSTYNAVARLGKFADALNARFAAEIARRSAPQLPDGGLAERQGYCDAVAMVAAATGKSYLWAATLIEVGQVSHPR